MNSQTSEQRSMTFKIHNPCIKLLMVSLVDKVKHIWIYECLRCDAPCNSLLLDRAGPRGSAVVDSPHAEVAGYPRENRWSRFDANDAVHEATA